MEATYNINKLNLYRLLELDSNKKDYYNQNDLYVPNLINTPNTDQVAGIYIRDIKYH